MKRAVRISWIVAAILVAVCIHNGRGAEQDGWQVLFNGRDLADWDGHPDLWSVRDGVIVGETKQQGQITYNHFLIWRGGVLKNFELRATVRIQGKNNSGIQYRSVERKDVGPWSISGYQCDVHPRPDCNAMCYEERGRGVLFFNGQRGIIDDIGRKFLLSETEPLAVDVGQWHEYEVVAVGNKISHKINGQVVSEVTDHDSAKRSLEGLLAIQLHDGPPMIVEIKDIRIKQLAEGGIVTLEQEPIPPEARLLAPAKPRKPAKPKPN